MDDPESQAKQEMDLNNIPTVPAATLKLMSMIFRDDVDIKQLIKDIEQDINLSNEIIKAANSPLYSTAEVVDNLKTAIKILGFDVIKKIVLSTAVLGIMQDQLSKENYSFLLTHSIATAAASKIVAMHAPSVNPDTAFLISLFLNLGLFACANIYPKDFKKYSEEAEARGLHIKTIIEENLPVNINEMSLKIATQWELPSAIIHSISHLDKVSNKLDNPNIKAPLLSVIAHLSSMAADVYFGSSAVVNIEKFKEHFQKLMTKKESDAADTLRQLPQEFNDLSTLLNFNLPKQSEYIEILRQANKELLKINADYEFMYKELSEKNLEMQNLANELHQKNRMLQKLLTTDQLTQLYNRRYLEKSLKRFTREAQRYNTNLSIILLDIDFFKKVNDNYGHQAGDEVLKNIAHCIKNSVRETDVCARYGGEEFIILLPHTNLKEANTTAEHCKKNLEQLKININTISPSLLLNVTASFGVATLSGEINSPDLLIQKADKLLYQAKQDGRNCIRY